MRWTAAFIILATPAFGWEFEAGPTCVLRDVQDQVSVTLTHDPSVPEFSISIRQNVSWVGGPIFAIAFVGDSPFEITTNRHVLSDDGQTLTVRDRGFGNVLNGMEFNATAIASLGDQQVTFDLQAVDEPLQPFRTCEILPVAAVTPLAAMDMRHG